MAVVMLLAIWLPASAASRILVEVVDSLSGEPVPFTAIYVTGSNQGAMAGEDGRVWLNMTRQRAELVFSAMGYAKKRVPVDQSVTALRVSLGISLTRSR